MELLRGDGLRSPHARGDGPTGSGCTVSRRYRSPHARGDGPSSVNVSTMSALFSPRAWGWSDRLSPSRRDHVQFSPRAWGWSAAGIGAADPGSRSPHARGDGPSIVADHVARVEVLPTRVGMVRPTPPAGDRTAMFSPRAWGWSGCMRRQSTHRVVLPTRVGMVRRWTRCSSPTRCSPHARGDGPGSSALFASGGGSPHARGDGPEVD